MNALLNIKSRFLVLLMVKFILLKSAFAIKTSENIITTNETLVIIYALYITY